MIEDEGESVGNWSLLEDEKDAGLIDYRLLEERGASAGCSIEGCDPSDSDSTHGRRRKTHW